MKIYIIVEIDSLVRGGKISKWMMKMRRYTTDVLRIWVGEIQLAFALSYLTIFLRCYVFASSLTQEDTPVSPSCGIASALFIFNRGT